MQNFEAQNKEILSQLARQQDLPNHECKISVKTISDESFKESYGDKRASITIIMPHTKHKEVREKYRV